jgi:Ni/Fe-hydrogenase subunit HybB-like protein
MSAVLGFVMNRLNVSMTGMEASLRAGYFPSVMEIAVTAGIVAMGFWIFSLAVRYLPIFTHVETEEHVVLLDVHTITPTQLPRAEAVSN